MKHKLIIFALITALIYVVLGNIVACTSTETPCLTISEQNYNATLANHASRVGEESIELAYLLEEPQMENDEWRIDVDTKLTTIRMLYDEALEIEPTSSMAHIHDKYLQAMYHYDIAIELVAEGIDTQNSNLLDQAVSEMELGIEDVEEATRLMDGFITARCP